jgi:hypothetical protein
MLTILFIVIRMKKAIVLELLSRKDAATRGELARAKVAEPNDPWICGRFALKREYALVQPL